MKEKEEQEKKMLLAKFSSLPQEEKEKSFMYNFSCLAVASQDKTFAKKNRQEQIQEIDDKYFSQLTLPVYSIEKDFYTHLSHCLTKLSMPVEEAADAYYSLAQEESDDISALKKLDNLTDIELEAIKFVEDFDIENLNLYKNLSSEEAVALNFFTTRSST